MTLSLLLIGCRGGGQAGPIVINELVASNDAAFEVDVGTPDYVELLNVAEARVELEGWGLGEPGEAPSLLGAGVGVDAGDYLVVIFEGGSEDAPGVSGKLSASGGVLVLWDPDGQARDIAEWEDLGTDEAWERESDGALTWKTGDPSPGEAN